MAVHIENHSVMRCFIMRLNLNNNRECPAVAIV